MTKTHAKTKTKTEENPLLTILVRQDMLLQTAQHPSIENGLGGPVNWGDQMTGPSGHAADTPMFAILVSQDAMLQLTDN